jgi:hypothetical protein
MSTPKKIGNLALVPALDTEGRTPHSKASRMREMVLALINGIGDVRDLPPVFMALRPFIPILAAKLETIGDEMFINLLEDFERRLHYVKTGDNSL